MQHLFFSLLFLFLLTSASLVQAQIDENEMPYIRETGAGINFNTNGGILGGVMFKHSTHIRNGVFHYFGFEFVNVKHPKEQRVASPVSGNSYIYLKQNYLFSFRPHYGREFLLFRQSEEEGIRISGVVAAGPTLGFVKPYAIDYDYTDYSNYNGPPIDVRAEPYDPFVHTDPQGRILGTGGFFTAMGKTKVVPGLNFKTGFSFEFGNSNTGLEVGTVFEIFTRQIILIPFAKNDNIFTSLYINIFFGVRD
jgi:hypothetical protein